MTTERNEVQPPAVSEKCASQTRVKEWKRTYKASGSQVDVAILITDNIELKQLKS